MTLMSGKVYSDAGTPSNATGENGDIFMQLDGLKTTYRKEGGAWTPIGNQLGTIPEFLKGIGVPSNAVGEDGQYYREVNTEAIYQKDAGVWTNIGSWTSLETQQLLQSNGIGADLATTNHVSNIDTFTEAGAEGYFDNTTTGTKPHTYGVVKVTKAGIELHQSSQTSTNKVATRVSGDTGTTWSVWRITANQDGDAGRVFSVADPVTDFHAVNLQTLVAALTDFITTTGYSFNPAEGIVLPDVFAGFSLKWGENTDSINNPVAVVFPTPFPNACFVVLPCTDSTTDNYSVEEVGISAKTRFGFKWHQSRSFASAYVHGWWLAVGY